MPLLSGFYKKLMLARQLEFKDGVYLIIGKRVVMTPGTILNAFQNVLLKEVGYTRASPLLYEMGYTAGYEWIKAYRDRLNITDSNKLFDFAAEFSTSSGWGNTELVSKDLQNKHFMLHTTNSPFLNSSHKNKKPICHILRGLYSGAGEVIFGETLGGIETKCQHLGDKYCEFIFKPLNEFKVDSRAAEQLNIMDLLDAKLKRKIISKKEYFSLKKKFEK